MADIFEPGAIARGANQREALLFGLPFDFRLQERYLNWRASLRRFAVFSLLFIVPGAICALVKALPPISLQRCEVWLHHRVAARTDRSSRRRVREYSRARGRGW